MADDGLDLTELVRRTAQVNAKLYKGWMDLSMEYFRGLSEIFGGASRFTSPPVQEMDSGGNALVIEGEAGEEVRASFLVSNDLDRSVSASFVISDFKDPTGASVVVRARFDPSATELAPAEQRVVRVTVPIEETLVAGVGYAGEISIKGMEGFAVPVVLRRQHVVEDDSPAVADVVSDVTSPPGKPPRKTSAGKKATKRRASL